MLPYVDFAVEPTCLFIILWLCQRIPDKLNKRSCHAEELRCGRKVLAVVSLRQCVVCHKNAFLKVFFFIFMPKEGLMGRPSQSVFWYDTDLTIQSLNVADYKSIVGVRAIPFE